MGVKVPTAAPSAAVLPFRSNAGAVVAAPAVRHYRLSVSGFQLPVVSGRQPATGNRQPATGNPYFEYSSTTSCSWAAIGMFGRDGFSSIRPLNVSLSTAIQESGAPRED